MVRIFGILAGLFFAVAVMWSFVVGAITFAEEGKPVEFTTPPFSWSDSLNYDPTLKLLVLHNSSARKVWLMKFERKTAKLDEMKDD